MSKHEDLPPAYSANAPNNPPGIGFNTPYPPPPQGQWSVPPPGPNITTAQHTQQPQSTATHTLVVTTTGLPIGPALGNCPTCRIGNVQAEFSCCGICLAIFFFPIGILCCLCMMNRRCSHCGAMFG